MHMTDLEIEELGIAPSASEIFGFDVGITTAQAAIAETGTLVLDSVTNGIDSFAQASSHRNRRCFNDLRDLGETLSMLQKGKEPARQYLHHRPIAHRRYRLTLTIGVHGPQEVYVIINQPNPCTSFPSTEDTNWRSPRMGIILHARGRDTGYRLDCEKLFDKAERPANPLAWFDMDGPWFQKARATHDTLVHDESLAEAREKGWLVPSRDAYWFAPVPRPGKIICIGLNYRDHAAEKKMPIPEKPVAFEILDRCDCAG